MSEPGLVLVHGAGGSIQTNYGPVLDGLAARHTVVGVDFPGSGDTPVPDAPPSVDALAERIIGAADRAHLSTFAIAGWSLGCAVAIRTAARHPERVQALVLTAPFAAADARLRLAAQLWHDLYDTGDRPLLLRFLMLVSRGTASLEAMTAQQQEAAAEMAERIIPPGTPYQADLVRDVDVRPDLSHVTARTLVISTTGDLLVSPVLHRQVADGIPDAQLATLNTGHLAFAEAPEQWVELMTAFLDKHEEEP